MVIVVLVIQETEYTAYYITRETIYDERARSF